MSCTPCPQGRFKCPQWPAVMQISETGQVGDNRPVVETGGGTGQRYFLDLWKGIQHTKRMLASGGKPKRNQEKEGKGYKTNFQLMPFALSEFSKVNKITF